ncbi:iron-containing alcohol dehydrogenase family protein [Siminovitchia sediminis]|uniref:Iron-containing alcohol dehydrogenase family protein n=1 Tax=Siminovitchia sediminis TaxID=1274353 RepID=A0ABW4KGR4_9BACI
MSHFSYIFYAQEVISGPGSIQKIKDQIDRFQLKNVMLSTTKGCTSRGCTRFIQEVLGDRLSLVYDEVLPHVQDFQVEEALRRAVKHEIDGIIGLGGGSAIGMAKALSHALEKSKTANEKLDGTPTAQPLIPVIAIPTTYAGSEMTPVYGITHNEDNIKRKVTVKDVKITPKSVIYDAEWTMGLPPKIAAGSGINAFAHCIEALYSISKNPVSTTIALKGIQLIKTSLLPSCSSSPSLSAKTKMLEGSFFAGLALANVEMGLHHGICHVLGGSAGVSHGDANSVMLPYVMLFNLDETAPELSLAAEAMGINTSKLTDREAGRQAAIQVFDWIKELGLPHRLKDLNVPESDISKLAHLAFMNKTVQNNPKRIESVEQLEHLLMQAWHGEIYSSHSG